VERVIRAAQDPSEIPALLKRMDREWDVERTLEANAASIAFIGVVLGALVSAWFLILPAIVTAFLLQHALQGWCPPLPLFRAMGVRTSTEINRERVALKALRGDFAALGEPGAPASTRARQAWSKAQLQS